MAALIGRGQPQKRAVEVPPPQVLFEKPAKIKMEIFEDGTEIPVFTDDANAQKPTLEVERAAAKKFDISNFDF